jgi:hypothetical protein
MANTWISRAATGSVTSSTTFTFSFWIKRATLSSTQYFFIHENASGHTQKLELLFQTDNTIRMGWYDGSSEYNYDTEMLFRDTSAWYNFVFRYDTTQSTDSNRVRMYVNGEQISYLNANGSSPTYMTQNKAMNLGQKVMAHGRYQSSNPGNYLTGSLSHIHYCDGQSYAPTSFGETDSTTGEWKIKANPSLTYGNNGYFILKDGNSVTNQAGNSSGNFSVSGGTLTKTEDCPSNVFATGNPIDNGADKNPVFLNGNNSYSVGSGVWRYAISTLGMTKGKFYMEQKIGSSGNHFAGATDQYDNLLLTQTYAGSTSLSVGYYNNGNKYIGDNATSYGNSYTSGDIIGVAIDIDNGKIYFSKNGTWQNSGVPTSGSTGTGAIDLPTSANSYGTWFFVPSVNNSTLDVNYGNGYFGTTAVSSAGTNASGNGIFEYDVPTGYTALSTKGLNL